MIMGINASQGARLFSTKKDKTDDPVEAPKKRTRMTKAQKLALEEEALKATGSSESVVDTVPKKTRKPRVSKKATQDEPLTTDVGVPRKMYVMKFNTPILPFSKFPLTQNKYI